ncbi:MAG TPA: hypothetical protein VIE14_07355 [Steroidobacteraceae bacterium]|jgi:hypothetical protein
MTLDSAARLERGLGAPTAQRASLDSLLNAVSTGKVLALADAWTGISRIADFYVAEAAKLDTPITAPNILHAEPTPEELNLGLVYDGLGALKAFADQVETAQANEAAAKAAVGRFREAVGSGAGGQVMRTGDTRHPGLASGRPVGDFSKPVSVSDVQRINDAHWSAEAAATPFREYQKR